MTYTEDKDNNYFASGGESFIAITEFGKAVKAKGSFILWQCFTSGE
jgi:hypothetical protein